MPADYIFCRLCGHETLHSVIRDGQGRVSNSACKDPAHTIRAAKTALVEALATGTIEAADIPGHPKLARHAQVAITKAVAALKAEGRVIVLRETGDRPNPFPFSALMNAAA